MSPPQVPVIERSSSDLLYFNGLDGSTGQYLIPPMKSNELARLALGETLDPDRLREAKWRSGQRMSYFGVKEDVDATDLAEAGWGVIFAAQGDPKVKDALGELLAHRRRQVDAVKPRFQVYEGPRGFRPTDTKNDFLARLGVGPGPVDPDKVPYYLLIVGDPETIPYAFQSQLDVAYAVGRIAFDTLDEYARYAHSVVQAETTGMVLPRKATFFGTRNWAMERPSSARRTWSRLSQGAGRGPRRLDGRDHPGQRGYQDTHGACHRRRPDPIAGVHGQPWHRFPSR